MKLTRAQLPLPLFLCVFTQALYAAFSVSALSYTARELLLGGVCAAVAMGALLFAFLLLGQGFSSEAENKVWKNVVCALACFVLLCGVVQTVLQQLQLYYRQFGSGGLWVVLLALCALCLGATPHALVRSARLFLLLCLGAAALCLLGLVGQSNVQHLSADALRSTGVSSGFWAGFAFYPEYLTLLVCPSCPIGKQGVVQQGKIRQGTPQQGAQPQKPTLTAQKLLLPTEALLLALPFFGVAVQGGMVLVSELVFGVQQAGVGGFEVLRSWAFLSFSRFDGVIVLLWLLLGYFRLRFLAFVAWQISPASAQKRGRRVGAR